MSLQLQYLHCRLIKVYNIKRGTKVNLVIYVLIWVPEIMQARHYFSTLEKYMSGCRRGEIKGSLEWECTPTIRALLLEGEKQISWWIHFIWVVVSGTLRTSERERERSKSQSYTLDLSSMAYAHISEDCTLKTFFAMAYMKTTTRSLCSRDRCLFS